MTIVQNTLLSDAGIPQANVLVSVALISSVPAFFEEEEIQPTATTHTDATGTWTLHLYPNSEISPDGTTYQVTETPSYGTLVNTFTVPVDGATPITHYLADLLV